MTVSADDNNYTNLAATDNMPPGIYTFTITGTTESETGIVETVKTTTVTWELTDPCATQVL